MARTLRERVRQSRDRNQKAAQFRRVFVDRQIAATASPEQCRRLVVVPDSRYSPWVWNHYCQCNSFVVVSSVFDCLIQRPGNRVETGVREWVCLGLRLVFFLGLSLFRLVVNTSFLPLLCRDWSWRVRQ